MGISNVSVEAGLSDAKHVSAKETSLLHKRTPNPRSGLRPGRGMSYEQFEEYILNAINKHISRDLTISTEDQLWEGRNAARAIAKALRVEGLRVPRPTEDFAP